MVRRFKIGFDVELIHDVHERPYPNQACALVKAVEPYRPFFMEDPFAPEDVGWFLPVELAKLELARETEEGIRKGFEKAGRSG